MSRAGPRCRLVLTLEHIPLRLFRFQHNSMSDIASHEALTRPRDSSGSFEMSSGTVPTAFSLPLRLTPHTTLHLQLTSLANANMIFLTTTSLSGSSSVSALGSFVYAMPDVRSITTLFLFLPSDPSLMIDQRLSPTAPPLSTPLYALPSTIEFCTRVAKIIAKRTKKPSYVGCSVSLEGATVEEEMEAMQVAIDGILQGLGDENCTSPTVNGSH